VNIAVATYPRLYVRPLEKQELDLVTSTCTMSCNVLLQDFTRHNTIVTVLYEAGHRGVVTAHVVVAGGLTVHGAT
jgi:hypothetical protein